MKNFTKEQLEKMYLEQKLTPYKIGEQLKCDHKTVRKYLKEFEIPLRSASEYNYLPRSTHITPSLEQLQSAVSLIGHALYLAEGWHTDKTTWLYFCNTDPMLIDAFLRCCRETYNVNRITMSIQGPTEESASKLLTCYPDAKLYLDQDRKKALVRVKVGGKKLAKEFISNARMLLSSKD